MATGSRSFLDRIAWICTRRPLRSVWPARAAVCYRGGDGRRLPAYEIGATPPLGPDTPVELIDPRRLDYGHVLCSAGDHEHSLKVDPADIVRVTGALTVDLRQD